jgi:hypothetical protein
MKKDKTEIEVLKKKTNEQEPDMTSYELKAPYTAKDAFDNETIMYRKRGGTIRALMEQIRITEERLADFKAELKVVEDSPDL